MGDDVLSNFHNGHRCVAPGCNAFGSYGTDERIAGRMVTVWRCETHKLERPKPPIRREGAATPVEGNGQQRLL